MPFKDAEAARAYRRAYRQANKTKIAAYLGVYYQTHRPEILLRQHSYKQARRTELAIKQQAYDHTHKAEREAYYAATKSVRAAKSVIYRAIHEKEIVAYKAAHKLERAMMSARRRARKQNAPVNDLTAAQWREILAAYGHCCVYCDRKMQRLTQDHIIPLSKGGSHTASNVVPACMSCNRKKQAGPPPVPVQPLLLTVA